MEFWEENFRIRKEMWGSEPATSAVLTKDLFVERQVKNVLIPGIGYGRNARVFKESGMQVAGIEISETAIESAEKHLGTEVQIHHGSVTHMPFDNRTYDVIFCHALIHLLDGEERANLLANAYRQLNENGYMVFSAVTKEAPNFGKGKYLGLNRYEYPEEAKIFYYDREAVQAEFAKFGLFEVSEVKENHPMFLNKCRKK